MDWRKLWTWEKSNRISKHHRILSWSYFVEGDEGWIGPSGKLLCLVRTKNVIHHMLGNIPNKIDSWDNPVVRLLELYTRQNTEFKYCIFTWFKRPK